MGLDINYVINERNVKSLLRLFHFFTSSRKNVTLSLHPIQYKANDTMDFNPTLKQAPQTQYDFFWQLTATDWSHELIVNTKSLKLQLSATHMVSTANKRAGKIHY